MLPLLLVCCFRDCKLKSFFCPKQVPECRSKIALNEVKEVRKILFKVLFIVVKREICLKSELISFETKGKEICKHWGEREHKPYVFANLLFPKEK